MSESQLTQLKERLSSLRDELLKSMKEQIEDGDIITPLCVAVYPDGREDFMYLRYESEEEKKEVFNGLNKHLEQSDALGCILVMETEFEAEGSSTVEPALYLQQKGFGVKSLEAHLFEIDGEEVKWGRTIGPTRMYEDTFLRAFPEEVH